MKKYEQAKKLLASMDDYRNPNDFSDEMIAALTADFDRLFELTWKYIKEYMLSEMAIREAATGSPKEILKLAYHEGLLDDEEIWLSMLKDRNDDTHHYLHTVAVLYASRINEKYLAILRECMERFSDRIAPEEISDGRLPATFLDEWRQSGLSMDDFVERLQEKNNLPARTDVFEQWEFIDKKLL